MQKTSVWFKVKVLLTYLASNLVYTIIAGGLIGLFAGFLRVESNGVDLANIIMNPPVTYFLSFLVTFFAVMTVFKIFFSKGQGDKYIGFMPIFLTAIDLLFNIAANISINGVDTNFVAILLICALTAYLTSKYCLKKLSQTTLKNA